MVELNEKALARIWFYILSKDEIVIGHKAQDESW